MSQRGKEGMEIEKVRGAKEGKEVKEVKRAKDKTMLVHLRLGDFPGPLLPSLPQHPSLPVFLGRVRAMRLAGSLAFLGAVLAFSPIEFAQTNPQTNKSSETAKTQDAP